MSAITQEFRISALRNGIVVRSEHNQDTNNSVLNAAVVEMANLGFIVSVEDITGMSNKALKHMLNDARSVIGADRDMTAIYPGFPQQVRELDTATLLVEQIVHYLSAGTLLPDYPHVVREGLPIEDMLRNAREVKVLHASKAAQNFVHELTTKGVALSPDDYALLKGSVTLSAPSIDEIVSVLKYSRHGENMQSLLVAYYETEKGSDNYNKILRDNLLRAVVPVAKSADQLLRFVLATSSSPVISAPPFDEDYKRAAFNLSEKDSNQLHMASLSRPARRVILNRLGELTHGFNADSLVARISLWRRVMRMIHPYSISSSDDAKRAVDIIHENIGHTTFNSEVEKAMSDGDVERVVSLLAEYQPGNLLRRLVAILRLTESTSQAEVLADAVAESGSASPLTTLISAYNGVVSINDKNARITRVAGLNNSIVQKKKPSVNGDYVNKVINALETALKQSLATKQAPVSGVGVSSDAPMPLVRRDLSTTDRVLNRGQKLTPVGDGDTVRVFSHWKNGGRIGGFIDIGAMLLDSEFNTLDTVTWDSWGRNRKWSTYSGDKFVSPGDTAAEYVDVDMKAAKEVHPDASWVAMTLQSWSGFRMDKIQEVDLIAGVMLRSEPDSGEPFDARSVSTAFRPTTPSFQAVPLAVNMKTGEMVWLDSSSGSTQTTVSAKDDGTVGIVVYDEAVRPRMSMGKLATLWADAHGVKTSDSPVSSESLLSLLD